MATGNAARSNDPSTWSTYADASSSTTGAGLGFVLAGDGICVVDLDDALDDEGNPLPAVAAWLDTLPPTWVEVSPSGRGLHVWGRGVVLTCRKLRREDGIAGEVIGSRKYATVTGRPFRGSAPRLANISGPVRSLLN